MAGYPTRTPIFATTPSTPSTTPAATPPHLICEMCDRISRTRYPLSETYKPHNPIDCKHPGLVPTARFLECLSYNLSTAQPVPLDHDDDDCGLPPHLLLSESQSAELIGAVASRVIAGCAPEQDLWRETPFGVVHRVADLFFALIRNINPDISTDGVLSVCKAFLELSELESRIRPCLAAARR